MLTNIIPITTKAPTLSRDNIDKILIRINTLHPSLNKKGKESYLCDLLNIENLKDITGEFLTFQETEPAVSSAELHELAERVLPYNDNNIHKAIFSARNILNTVPKSIDDLADYTTQERLREFIGSLLSRTIMGINVDVGSITNIDDLVDVLEGEEKDFIEFACNEQMDEFQKLSTDDNMGITHRQRMLYAVSNYYLNHRVGFECNSIWLAIFINHQTFGCSSGWTHINGDLCESLHFGFKDEKSIPKLILSSLDYIDAIFKKSRSNTEVTSTVHLYIETLISAIEILNTKRLCDKEDNRTDSNTIHSLLQNNKDLLSQKQKLRWVTVGLMEQEGIGFSNDQFRLLNEVINEQEGEPEKQYQHFFDAWNFFVFDHQTIKAYKLAPLLLRANYESNAMDEFSDIIINHINDDDLPSHMKDIFFGYFKGYLWNTVNENSDSHYLYDAILKTSLKASNIVDNGHVIRLMAEFGHKSSMIELSKDKSKEEKAYWEERISLIND
jgi:hypothetical protein